MITSLLSQDPQAPQRWSLPVQASTFAEDHDNLYTFVEWINYVFFFGIVLVLFYAVVKYRRKTPDQPPASTITHHTAMEVTWTVIPLIIVMIIFAWGWQGYENMTLAPADSLQYEVKAQRWVWKFKHPGTTNFVSKEFWVPVDTPAQLTMSSSDMLHSFFIPAFRLKRDVLPGRYQTVWFQATYVGDYRIYCAEYCGAGHSKMIGFVHVVSKEKWAEYQKIGADVPWDPFLPTDDPEDPDYESGRLFNGNIIYTNNCSQCHTLNGTRSTGPSFKGLWARNLKRLGLESMTPEDQEKKMAQYILKSVRDPNAYIVETYPSPSPMTPFTEEGLSDERVNDIVGFLKSDKLK